MATTDIDGFCSSCGKQNGRATCKGCSKLFCFKDFEDHHKELGRQLDEIEGERNLFRQMLTENSSNPQNHTWIKQIDQWENQSINRIQQEAEEARKILIDHTTKLNRDLEEKLKVLTTELRKSREENDFFEPNLNQWGKELTQMKAELTEPSNITIRNSSKVLVTKIIVDRLDERVDKIPHATTRIANTCPYCNCEFDQLHIKQHQDNCLSHPNRKVKKQQSQNYASSNKNRAQKDQTDLSCQNNDPYANTRIPCELCGQAVPLEYFENHAIACRNQEHKRLEERQRLKLSSLVAMSFPRR